MEETEAILDGAKSIFSVFLDFMKDVKAETQRPRYPLVMGAAAYSSYLIAKAQDAKVEAAKKDVAQPGARVKRNKPGRSRIMGTVPTIKFLYGATV